MAQMPLPFPQAASGADRRHTQASGKRQSLHKANQKGAAGLADSPVESRQPAKQTAKKRPTSASRHNDG